jgi:hypothetical protein|tara:strand:- start:192 stop:311 length:120 start_codon:yes stop_codon:yes gene_type:complete
VTSYDADCTADSFVSGAFASKSEDITTVTRVAHANKHFH